MNSNLPNDVPPVSGLSNPDVINVPPVSEIPVKNMQDENITSVIPEAVVAAPVPSEIPVTYAEPVQFEVPIEPAPVVVAAPPETPLAQPVSPITGTDGPTNKNIELANRIISNEDDSVIGLSKMSADLDNLTSDQI